MDAPSPIPLRAKPVSHAQENSDDNSDTPENGPVGTESVGSTPSLDVEAASDGAEPPFGPPRKIGPILLFIMKHPDLMLAFVSFLDIKTLMNLYAISKPFHFFFNQHYTSFILANARETCGYDTPRIFPHRSYRRLCKLDPTERDVNAPYTVEASYSPAASDDGSPGPVNEREVARVRQIPGIKWLSMVQHRVTIVKQLVHCMLADGLVFPIEKTHTALKKLWFLMDIPYNGGRIGYIHDRKAFTDMDLIVAMYFFFALDKRFSDVRCGTGSRSLRKLLMEHRGLTPVLETLERKTFKSQISLLKSIAYLKGSRRSAHLGNPLFGLPAHLVGSRGREARGRGLNKLMRPDELVAMEVLRRKINPRRKLMLPFLLVGKWSGTWRHKTRRTS